MNRTNESRTTPRAASKGDERGRCGFLFFLFVHTRMQPFSTMAAHFLTRVSRLLSARGGTLQALICHSAQACSKKINAHQGKGMGI